MASESGSNPELLEQLEQLGMDRVNSLSLTVLGVGNSSIQDVSAAIYNFSIVAMAIDDLDSDKSKHTSHYGPDSWILTAREIIESDPITSEVLASSIFFSPDRRAARRLNRWVSARVPSGLYDPEEFASDVLSGRIAEMDPRDN